MSKTVLAILVVSSLLPACMNQSDNNEETDEAVSQVTLACYRIFQDCDIAGFWGILNGSWTAYSCDVGAITRCTNPSFPWALRIP